MILTPYGITFHPVVVIGLGKNLLFKSVLAHCGMVVWLLVILIGEPTTVWPIKISGSQATTLFRGVTRWPQLKSRIIYNTWTVSVSLNKAWKPPRLQNITVEASYVNAVLCCSMNLTATIGGKHFCNRLLFLCCWAAIMSLLSAKARITFSPEILASNN